MCTDDALLNYPNFNRPFDIHTYSSSYQTGAVISQNNKPLVYWSKMLSKTHQQYPITDFELLCIVETIKVHKNLLYGQEIEA